MQHEQYPDYISYFRVNYITVTETHGAATIPFQMGYNGSMGFGNDYRLFFMTFCGCIYAFGLISATLKSRLNLSQSELNTIDTLGRMGAGSSIICGVFNNRYGPTVSIWVGLAITFLGWGSVVLLAQKIIDLSHFSYSIVVLMVGVANFAAMHGISWLGAIAGPTIAQNFPRCDHGKYLGLAKGFLGIGSAYIATFKADLVDGDIDKFMYSVLFYIPLFGLCFGWFLRQIPDKEYVHKYRDNEHADRWKWWYFVACVLALYLITMTIVQNLLTFDPLIGIIIFIIAQILWLSPLGLAMINHGPFWLKFHDDESPLLIQQNESTATPQQDAAVEMGMPDIFKTWDFWLLYATCVIVDGSGLILISNAAQIVESALSDSEHERSNESVVTSLVSIISIGSFIGRITSGALSDKFIDRYPRVFWCIFSALGMCLSALFMFFVGFLFDGNPQITVIGLLFAAFFIGMSYGWIFSVILASVSDLWGTKYLSGNCAFFDSCTLIGQMIFCNGIFATLYEYQGNTENDGNECYGNRCFQYAFLIASASCLIAAAMAVRLWRIQVQQDDPESKGIEIDKL